MPIVPTCRCTRATPEQHEYKVLSLRDQVGGCVDPAIMQQQLNALAADGWRVVAAYSNDIGTNAVSIGGIGINSSVGQNILLLERIIPAVPSVVDVPVIRTHQKLLFRSKNIQLQLCDTGVIASLQLYCNAGTLQGIKANLDFLTIFDEHILCQNSYFVQFAGTGISSVWRSTFSSVPITEEQALLIQSVDVDILSYVQDNQISTVHERLLEEDTGISFSKQDLLSRLQEFDTCREIYDYCSASDPIRFMLGDELINSLLSMANTERLYGNMKESAIRQIDKNVPN